MPPNAIASNLEKETLLNFTSPIIITKVHSRKKITKIIIKQVNIINCLGCICFIF